MTRETMHRQLDNAIASRIYNKLSSIGASYEVRVSKDLTPRITINTNDEWIRVRVSAEGIYDQNETLIGYEFIPTISNAGLNQQLDETNAVDIVNRFSRWAKLADAVKNLYLIEFYFDDVEEG